MTAIRSSRRALLTAALAGIGTGLSGSPVSAQTETVPPDMSARIQALIPDLEAEIARGMKAFNMPGLAIGIVHQDQLAYAKGFGVGDRATNAPVTTRTVFQIGSTTKAFLAATLAMMVDRGHFRWDDRVADLYPDFVLHDPWVTREFRVFDLIAQRSGLPPYVNDALAGFGFDQTALIRSLRFVEPVSSFRSTFGYINIAHMVAGRIVAKAAGAADWNAVLQSELLTPLGMKDSSFTADAIIAAPDHATGHVWSPQTIAPVPFTQLFPYDYDGAGDINSTIEDMAQWLRLQIFNGTLKERSYVSPAGMAATRTPKVGMTETLSYALGWVVQNTPNGTVIWHNGGTSSFGAFVGFLPDHGVGAVVLTNTNNVGLPDALGAWVMDRLLSNPPKDHIGTKLKNAQEEAAQAAQHFARPADPQAPPPFAPLAGHFENPAAGRASVEVDGERLLMTLEATGARFSIDPWNGDVFTAKLLPEGRLKDLVLSSGPLPTAFAQYQMSTDGKPDRLKLSMPDGQAYLFERVAASG
ncbi:serine hydrolase [Methylovirgula sp. 4M-Z18]|uniref:serine hydrolase n=1 Tax=Methylovirgula sp. 4M-Z18 TaxID=2293567 RepID=UPI000E2F0D0C|nr:serine hydrolase [Methylovirgula sp. 4M-Z18]RFB81424.1 serine hydrolase [Methylovirgula sp. 4M-Z18]